MIEELSTTTTKILLLITNLDVLASLNKNTENKIDTITKFTVKWGIKTFFQETRAKIICILNFSNTNLTDMLI